MRRMALSVLVALLLAAALPAQAEVTAEEVAEAREELRALSSALEGQVEAYEAAVAEEAELRNRVDALIVALAARERELVVARREAKIRAASMYMSAGTEDVTGAMVSAREMAQTPARYVYLDTVSETDLEVVNRLEAARRDFTQQKALLDEAVDVQAGLRAEMDEALTSIYDQLEAANEEYQAIKQEWDAQEQARIERERYELWLSTSTTTTTSTAPTTTLASTPPTTAGTPTTVPATTSTAPPTTPTTVPGPALPAGTMVCPIDGATTFRDSWGEPRSGGRGHKGVDMMAARWTPIVAIEAGAIYRISWSSLGGLGVYVLGESGGLWYYAHNEATAEGLYEGQLVGAGQRIAYVGSSGNAGIPHLHFGWMPNADWVFQNPFPIVDALCR